MSDVTPTPFSSLLVANRGEIARRIIRSAHEMGIRCVAVFADDDAGAPHVREADEAVRLTTGYLDGAAVIEAARRTGAQAVHPGYGFLAENAAFAADVIAAGLVWVGPSPDVIASMGDKLAAKHLAVAAGVPTLPSTDDADDTEAAARVGYPLLVKAAAGGGGKGMRIVHDPADLAESVAAARREAANAFGDDRVFLEHYVAASRHVEIQILGDAHGEVVHLGERECSIQRRHQKIVEESPSPVVDEELRAAMGHAALSLARAIGYQSAGTVEFLVDDATSAFYFLEVNTRLQVEHPVTEAVTGIDLVREQLRVAAGEPLGYLQSDVRFHGAAIEVRLYAEDPSNGFLPAIGTLDAFEPSAVPAVRWDSGVETGSVVGVRFDPMLAKVIAHAPTRSDAAARLALALERLHLGGVVTNRDFLAATLRHPAFVAGDTTTDFIDRHAPAAAVPDDAGLHRLAIVAALWLQRENRRSATALGHLPSGWRYGRLPDQKVSFAYGDRTVEIAYKPRRDGSFVMSGADSGVVAVVHPGNDSGVAGGGAADDGTIDVEIDGRRATHRVTRAGDRLHVQSTTTTVTLEIVPRFTLPGAEVHGGGLLAPMPGVVLDVRVAVGDQVEKGTTLVVLEAMKMEHHIKAPEAGTVSEVRVAVGARVDNQALLLTIDPT